MNITYYAIQIMRELIKRSSKAKSKFIDSEKTIEAVVNIVSVENYKELQECFDPIAVEGAIYSFLTQCVREEMDYKRIVGKHALLRCKERI